MVIDALIENCEALLVVIDGDEFFCFCRLFMRNLHDFTGICQARGISYELVDSLCRRRIIDDKRFKRCLFGGGKNRFELSNFIHDFGLDSNAALFVFPINMDIVVVIYFVPLY